MSLEISSWFSETLESGRVSLGRHFSIGGSDFSEKVLKWPNLVNRAGSLELGTVSLMLSNHDRAFDFFIHTPERLTSTCEIKLGLTHPESGEETISLYTGEPASLNYLENGNTLRIALSGKTRSLGNITLGTNVESGGLSFTESAYFPCDLVWTLVTCYGGLSNVASSSNPDIHYDNWQVWREWNMLLDTRVKGYLAGEKMLDVLNHIAHMDSVVMMHSNGRMDFSPWVPFSYASVHEFNFDQISHLKYGITPSKIINRFSVDADFIPGGNRFISSYLHVNSNSQATYGVKSGRFGGRFVWFASAQDGRFLAETKVGINQEPKALLELTTPLAGGVKLTLGDYVTLADSVFPKNTGPLRISEMAVELESGRINFQLQPLFERPWVHYSRVSSFNMEMKSITPIGDKGFFALSEQTLGELFKTDLRGEFKPQALYGDAFLALNENEILIGGVSALSTTQAVIQRTSKGRGPATVVSSLLWGMSGVKHFFQVFSGTILASTSSGGIWRSTDAGSSWGLTQSITSLSHIACFFSPTSGVLWGSTGFESYERSNGLFIWESTDFGISWVEKYTLAVSGPFRGHTFYALNESEVLLASDGFGIKTPGIFRSYKTSSPTLAWSRVSSEVGFCQVTRLSSGDLMIGSYEFTSQRGGTTFRSRDEGWSWEESSNISKKGNVYLYPQSDHTLKAMVSRASNGVRTELYHNKSPNEY